MHDKLHSVPITRPQLIIILKYFQNKEEEEEEILPG